MWLSLLCTILIAIVIYLLAIMPKLTNRPDITPWKDLYYAHRGLHQSHLVSPENSMTAFCLAVEHQYGIELDVQLTKDKIPVVFHDFTLKRVCGVDRKVCDLTLSELQTYPLYNSEEIIPTFQSVLDMVDGQVPIIIEFKASTHNVAVCEICSSILDQYKGLY